MLQRLSITKHREKAPTEPDVKLYTKRRSFYPGDKMDGVVVLEVYRPLDLLTLELKLMGEERAGMGNLLYKRSQYDEKEALYYLQYVTLLGENHDELMGEGEGAETTGSWLGRRRSTFNRSTGPPQSRPSFTSALPGEGQEESLVGTRKDSVVGTTPSGPRNVHLQSGTYVIPFRIILPNVIPPSMRIDRGREAHCSLTYTCTARLVTRSGSKFVSKRQFGVQALPVQLQRWLTIQRAVRVQEDPEGVTGGPARRSITGDPIVEDDTLSRFTTITLQASAESPKKNDDDDVALRRRLKHDIRFSDEMIAEEDEMYARRKAERKRRSTVKEEGGLTIEAVNQLGEGAAKEKKKMKKHAEKEEEEQKEETPKKTRRRYAAFKDPSDGDEEEEEEEDRRRKDAEDRRRKEDEENRHRKEEEAGSEESVEREEERDKEDLDRELDDDTRWEEHFEIPLRAGLLGTSKSVVEVNLSFESIVLVRSRGVIRVKALVDNSNGSSTITKLKYTLIIRGLCRGRGASASWTTEMSEVVIPRTIKKGSIERIDQIEIPLPSDMPLSIITSCLSTTVHFNCRLFATSGLSKFSRSAECELLVVSGIDRKNKSTRLRRWTNYFRESKLGRRSSSVTPNNAMKEKYRSTAPCKDFHDKNAAFVLMSAEEYDGPEELHVAESKLPKEEENKGEEGDEAEAETEGKKAGRFDGKKLYIPLRNPHLEYRRLMALLSSNSKANPDVKRCSTFVPRDGTLVPTHVDPMSASFGRPARPSRPGNDNYGDHSSSDGEQQLGEEDASNPFAPSRGGGNVDRYGYMD